MIRRAIKTILNAGALALCRREYKKQEFVRFNERPVEYGFLFRHMARLCPRTVLDIGTGTTALPHILRHCGCVVTAVDNMRDYWPPGTCNRHFHVIDDDITRSQLTGDFDFAVCISVLEHIPDADQAVRYIFRLLAPKGHLVLTFPYTETEYVKNVYDLPGSTYGQDFPFICQSYSRSDLDRWLTDNGGALIEQEYWQFWEGPYWTVGSQILPPVRADVASRHQLTCILIEKTASNETSS